VVKYSIAVLGNGGIDKIGKLIEKGLSIDLAIDDNNNNNNNNDYPIIINDKIKSRKSRKMTNSDSISNYSNCSNNTNDINQFRSQYLKQVL
jgi:hypothetical protein